MVRRLPPKCLVDTNVPKTANLSITVADVPVELIECVLTCVEAVEYVQTKGRLVLDGGDEIYDEYRGQLEMSGEPGPGDKFMLWVHNHRYESAVVDRVAVTRDGDAYQEFPNHDGLSNFDPSDRKFVAVANAHPEKPPILQATDSKWWGWKDALAEVGITVRFLCPDYVQAKYEKKMET